MNKMDSGEPTVWSGLAFATYPVYPRSNFKEPVPRPVDHASNEERVVERFSCL